MGEQRALIFGSVCYDNWDFLTAEGCLVFCADGGVHCARAAGFAPDYYIGDGDSGGQALEGGNNILLKPEKDMTDLQAAYELARNRGCTAFTLTGCTGGRQDHHLAALQLLETMYHDGIADACICDPDNEIRFRPSGRITLPPQPFRYFSLIPIDRRLEDVTIHGAKYALDHQTVARGDSLTVSNEWIGSPVEIEVGSGCAWLIFSGRK